VGGDAVVAFVVEKDKYDSMNSHERQVDEWVVGVPCGMLTSGVGVVGKGETCASMVDGAW